LPESFLNFPFHVIPSKNHTPLLHNSLEMFLRFSLFYENRQLSVTQTVADVTAPLGTEGNIALKELLYIVSG